MVMKDRSAELVLVFKAKSIKIKKQKQFFPIHTPKIEITAIQQNSLYFLRLTFSFYNIENNI
jgi:hypothetical protein